MDHAAGAPEPLDVACDLLRQSGAPIIARALLQEALRAAGRDPENAAELAELQTEISLDNRFQPAARGAWGLREWIPKPKPARSGKAASVHRAKAVAEDDESGETAEATEDWD